MRLFFPVSIYCDWSIIIVNSHIFFCLRRRFKFAWEDKKKTFVFESISLLFGSEWIFKPIYLTSELYRISWLVTNVVNCKCYERYFSSSSLSNRIYLFKNHFWFRIRFKFILWDTDEVLNDSLFEGKDVISEKTMNCS